MAHAARLAASAGENPAWSRVFTRPGIGSLARTRRVWAVSGPAIEAGRLALRDREWLAAAKGARAADASRLDGLLAPLADAPPRGTILYRLMESRRAPDLFAHLGGSGIWVRRFAHDPRLLRFGLPGSEEAWSRLKAALGSFA